MSDDHEELTARLRRLEDLEAIRQLFVDYGYHLDHGNLEAYGELFDEDAELLLGPVGKAKGRPAITEAMAETMRHAGRSYHLITSPRIELDGDRATTEVMWTVVVRGEDGKAAVPMIGHHEDVVVRRGDRWVFASRRGFVEVPSVYPGPAGRS
jgi:uncharacterized protein (TIGR02246 family)